MVNFGLLTAEIHPVVWGTPANFSTGFASWQRYCTASSSGRQPNFAALNRGRTTCVRQGDHHVGHWPTFQFFFFKYKTKAAVYERTLQ